MIRRNNLTERLTRIINYASYMTALVNLKYSRNKCCILIRHQLQKKFLGLAKVVKKTTINVTHDLDVTIHFGYGIQFERWELRPGRDARRH